MKFRKKPIEIEAIQYTGESRPLLEWLLYEESGKVSFVPAEQAADRRLVIRTLEGTMIATPGDWIIRGVKGELYPCKPDIFAKSYDPADAPAPLTFDRLAEANDARAKQWNPTGQDVPLSFAVLELCGEVGELANEMKKLERGTLGLVGGKDDFDNFDAELADVVICADLVARQRGINLGEAVARKFNATSHKHGFTVKLPEAGSQ